MVGIQNRGCSRAVQVVANVERSTRLARPKCFTISAGNNLCAKLLLGLQSGLRSVGRAQTPGSRVAVWLSRRTF